VAHINFLNEAIALVLTLALGVVIYPVVGFITAQRKDHQRSEKEAENILIGQGVKRENI